MEEGDRHGPGGVGRRRHHGGADGGRSQGGATWELIDGYAVESDGDPGRAERSTDQGDI